MRKLAVSLAALALFVVLALIVAAISLNRIVAAEHDAIMARVQTLVGRPVQVADIRVHLGAGLGIGLTQVQIADDPDVSPEPFLRADEITAQLKLRPLLARRLEVGALTFTRPTIRVIRAADGHWNYESIGHESNRAMRGSGIVRVATGGEPVSAGAPFALRIDSVSIDDGAVVFIDRGHTPPAATSARQVSLRSRDVSRDRPISFQLRAAVESEQENVRLTGLVGPWSQRARLPVTVQGRIGPFAWFNAVADQVDLRAVVTPDGLEMEHLGANALGGVAALSGSYALSPGGPVRLVGELRAISMTQLLAVRGDDASAHPIQGTGSLQLDLHGATGTAFPRSLAGTVRAQVTGGAIRNLNLVSDLLDRVSGLPGLAQLVSQRVKPKYARLFAAPDTRFETLKATLQVADGRATTNDLTVAAEDFSVRGAGWFTLDRDVDMNGTLVMSQRFSRDVVADVKEAKYVVDDHGQIAIPFTLRGKLGRAKPIPDSAFLGELLGRAVGRGGAEKLMDKLLGGKKREGAGQEKPADLIERGLRDLLGR